MKVKEENIPNTVGISNALDKIDFTDTFSTTNHKDNLWHLSELIFAHQPKWIKLLFKIRNTIVKKMGLKTDMPAPKEMKYEVGEHIGFFKIYAIQSNELILGANDKHLNFRVSIFNSGERMFNIKVTTLVKYHNTFGKVYMTIIKPFHHLIVRTMVANAYSL